MYNVICVYMYAYSMYMYVYMYIYPIPLFGIACLSFCVYFKQMMPEEYP